MTASRRFVSSLYMKPPFSPAKWSPSYTVVLLSALVIAVAITIYVLSGYSRSLDERVFAAIAPHRTPGRTSVIVVISFFANHLFLIPVNFLLLFFLLYTRRRTEAVYLAVVSLSSLSIMSVLKRSFHRHRPDHSLVDGIVNYSFPSGHAFMSVALYGLLIWWIAVTVKNRIQRRWLIGSLFVLMTGIGFTRVYLQVHYFTDILAGWAYGTAWLCCGIWLSGIIIARNTGRQ